MAILMLAKQLRTQTMLGHPVQTCTMYAQAIPLYSSSSRQTGLATFVDKQASAECVAFRETVGSTILSYELPEDLFFFLN